MCRQYSEVLVLLADMVQKVGQVAEKLPEEGNLREAFVTQLQVQVTEIQSLIEKIRP